MKYLLLAALFCSSTANAQGMKLLGDVSIPPYEYESLAKKYCSKVVDVTQRTADDLASSLQVSSNSIQVRGAYIVRNGPCCVKMDTPKGPITRSVWQYYDGKRAEVIAHMNTVNVKSSDSVCSM